MKAFRILEPLVGIITDAEVPVPADDEVLIEVKAAGLCGTDIHIYKGEYFGGYPRIPGHEFSGVVAGIGKNVTRFKNGMRVSADPNIFCESCSSCKENLQNFCEDLQVIGVTRDGSFAQYVTVPERCVFDIKEISFSEAAFIEPLACVVYGQEMTGIPVGSSVLIFGAGPIGLLHAQLAAINGAASVTVVDLYKEKLILAKKLGVTNTYLSADFIKLGLVKSFKVVIDCTGIPQVVEDAVKYTADTGSLLLFGVCPSNSSISINPYEVFRRELKIIGTFALKKTFGKALALVLSGRIKLLDLIGTKLTLDEAPGVFVSASSGNSGMKVMIYPNGVE